MKTFFWLTKYKNFPTKKRLTNDNFVYEMVFSVVSTSTPQNEAELQLYRVLQRASLLAYYDTLLEMGKQFDASTHGFHHQKCSDWALNFDIIRFYILGGDDVQQLCEAGQDEFLEIMTLVGMASKPLHVRRFQKALAEWVSNPPAFKMPLSSLGEFIQWFLWFFSCNLQ